jgi:hypothetical protein
MKIGWGLVAGLGTAGLLLAGIPAWAQTGSSGSTTGKGTSSGSSGSTTDSSKGSSGSPYGTGSGSTSGSMGGPSDVQQEGPHHGHDSSATGMGSSMGSTAASAGASEMTGKVQKVDKKNGQLTLAIKVSPSTQVTKNGQAASLSDIKEGDQVRASFSGSTVTQIEIMSKGATSGSMGGSSTGTGSSGSSPDTGSSTGKSGSSSGQQPPAPSGRGY